MKKNPKFAKEQLLITTRTNFGVENSNLNSKKIENREKVSI